VKRSQVNHELYEIHLELYDDVESFKIRLLAMKKLKFLLTVLLTAILTVFITSACNSQVPGTVSAPNESPAKILRMATSADYPPYEFIQTSSGSEEIVGFDIDIANYITSELGYGLEVNNIDFNGLIPALQAGRADFVMAGMTPTEERKQNADFSIIYFDAQMTIVAQKGSNLTEPANLTGKKVGVQLGSIQEEAAKKIQGVEIVPLNRINEIVQELKTGRIDAAIIEDTVAKGYTESNPDLEFNIIPDNEPGSAIAFPKGSELVAQFNEVLQEMLDSGKIDELVNQWFGSEQLAGEQPAG
jgi:polar amino acid transport system substrate-binding protein